jgi:hypothetical protein
VVAAFVSGATLVIVRPLEFRYFGLSFMRLTFMATAVTGLSVLWLADHFGMMDAPYSSGPFDLTDRQPSPDPRRPNVWREGMSDFAWYVWTIIRQFSRRR